MMEKQEKKFLISRMENHVTYRNSSSYSILGDFIAGCAIDAIENAGYKIVVASPCPDCGKPLVSGHGGGETCSAKCGYWFCF